MYRGKNSTIGQTPVAAQQQQKSNINTKAKKHVYSHLEGAYFRQKIINGFSS